MMLGVDHGKKRVGVSLSDQSLRIALPLEVLPGKDRFVLLNRCADLVAQHGVTCVVVGHPLTLMGEVGAQARSAEEFAQRLRHRLGEKVDVLLWDERLTSKEVDRARPSGKSKASKDGTRDLMAAVLILQSFLDRKANERGETGAP